MISVSAVSRPAKISLLVKRALILTMDPQRQVIADGAVAIDQDRIVAVGNTPRLAKAYRAEREIDASGCIVIPGLINAHTHLPMSYFKGVADDLPLQEWLNQHIWPLEQKFILNGQTPDPDFIYDASLHGAAELIRNGVTLANDMYFGGDAIARAVTKAGLRCLIGEPILDNGNGKKQDLSRIGQSSLRLAEQYRDNPLLDFTLAPHAIYTSSREALERCAELALQTGLRVHMHVSETPWEVEECRRRFRKKPIFYLQDTGLLDTRLILAHGIYVDKDEMCLLESNHVSVVICTESNLKLASGFAPIKSYLYCQVHLCFGTDGVASNNNLDLLSELDFTAKLHKALNNDPTFLPAEQILRLATLRAAQAIGLERELGSLEPGKLADLVILDCNSPEAQPLHNPYSQVVYTLGGRAVRDVIINGRTVLENKKLLTLDEAELIDKARYYACLIRGEDQA